MGASYLDEDRLRRSITAIATATGRGAIGIVRVSGRDAIQVAARVFSRPGRLTEAASHTITLGKIRHPNGSTIDEVIAAVMRAPNSYTGDDSVEFQCHGGHVPTNGVLRACLDVPRHRFVPVSLRDQAHTDRPLPIGHRQLKTATDHRLVAQANSQRLTWQLPAG